MSFITKTVNDKDHYLQNQITVRVLRNGYLRTIQCTTERMHKTFPLVAIKLFDAKK